MQLTKGAMGNLINRYSAVLKKCRLMNMFGSLAVASMLVMGGAGIAGAEDSYGTKDNPRQKDIIFQDTDITYTGNVYLNNAKIQFIQKNNVNGKGKITLGSNDSIISIKGSNSGYGVNIYDDRDAKTDESAATGGAVVELTGKKINIYEEEETWVGGIYIGSDVDKYSENNNKIKVSSVEGTNIEVVTKSNATYAEAIIAHSGAIIEITGPLTASAKDINGNLGNVISTRGDATINIGKDEKTVKLIGDIEFDFDADTSGTAINSNVNIVLNSKESYWQGNTLAHWKGTPTAEQQKVTNLNLTLKDGATWLATKVSQDVPSGRQQKYTPLNKLTINNGNINVNNGVTIEVDNITGDGSLTNAGNVTFTAGNIDLKLVMSSGTLTLGKDLYAKISNAEGSGKLTNAGTLTLSNATVADNVAMKDGCAIYNSGKLTLSGTNTFTGNTVDGKSNDIHNAANAEMNVTEGTTTLYSGLITAGKVTISNGGTLDLAAGSTLQIIGDGSVTITDGTFIADKSQMLTEKFEANTDNGISDASIIGTSGNLNIRLNGEEYTAEQYQTAKNELLATGSAVLNFINGTLKMQEGDSLVAGTEGTEGDALTLRTGPVVAGNGQTAKNGASQPSAADQLVQIVDNNDLNKKLLAASSLTTQSNTFTAKGLQIKNSTNAGDFELNINNNSSITLTGSGLDSSPVMDEQNKVVRTKVTVDDTSTLNLGLAGASNQGMSLAAADIKGKMNATAGTYAVDDMTVNSGATVNVLNSRMVIKNFKAVGGSLFVDPAYVSIAAADSEFGTALLVSTGSTVNLGGMDETALRDAMSAAGFSPSADMTVGSSQSVLALASPLTLTTGKIIVDAKVDQDGKINGSAPAAAAYFGKDSLLIVKGGAVTETAALTTTGTAEVKDGARLHVADAKAGSTYKIINASEITVEDSGWQNDNLTIDNKLLQAELVLGTDNKTADVTVKSVAASSVLPGIDSDLARHIDAMTMAGMTNPDSDNYGERFINRAVNRLSADHAAKTVEGAAKMAFAAAVPQTVMSVSNAAADTVLARTSFAAPAGVAGGAVAMNEDGAVQQQGLSAGDGMKNGFGMWIAPLYRNMNGFGFESGNFEGGYRSNFGGLALGADYTVDDAFRFGLTVNMGAGYTESTGDFAKTTNNSSWWGFGAYAGWNNGSFGLTADAGWTVSQNAMKQEVPGALEMGDLEADATVTNFSAGLRGEYRLQTSVMDIVPHAGVRVNSLHAYGYDVESAGRTVYKADDLNATVWQFPVGVTFSRAFTAGAWNVTPQLDLSVIPAAGDLEARQEMRVPGVPGSAEMDSSIMDAWSGRATLGIEAKHDNGVSLGLNYSYQMSEHTSDHGVQASFSYEF